MMIAKLFHTSRIVKMIQDVSVRIEDIPLKREN